MSNHASSASSPLIVVAALAAIAFASLSRAQDAASDRAMATLARNPAVKAALASAKANEPQTIENQIRLSEIPAPPFKEAVRGEEMKRLFQQLGLQGGRIDKAGNVRG